ncbi:unnamed protein product [Cuscuta europaea]|uniref:Uncharacterized protein n=1 Tax=Cuscuta europaea TaxID=41803 RepID=A0A9P1A0X0_CUSEU|nr:unnamed protein product [Cuscuta europaea]
MDWREAIWGLAKCKNEMRGVHHGNMWMIPSGSRTRMWLVETKKMNKKIWDNSEETDIYMVEGLLSKGKALAIYLSGGRTKKAHGDRADHWRRHPSKNGSGW